MATVLVTGGSGTLGSLLVPKLRGGGHDVRVLSRRAGRGTHQGDLTTGEGVAGAVEGASLVVHAASDARRMGRADVTQTTNLLAAATKAEHLLYISIVGIDRIRYSYYRQKLRCEELIASSGVPHTIFRATQFHELLAMVLRVVERLPVAPLPLDFRFQTVAASEVADRMAHLLMAPPSGRAEDMGGPVVQDLGEMVDQWRSARGRPRRVVRLRLPGRSAAGFRQGLNTNPDRATGKQTWAEYISAMA